MARLEKPVQGPRENKAGGIFSFKDDGTKRRGRLARLAGRFVLCSLIALSPAFAGQHPGAQPKSKDKTEQSGRVASIFPTLQRIASFSEPEKKKAYDKEVIRTMSDVDTFMKRNSGNRAFMLIAEAVMEEVLSNQTDKGTYYYIDANDTAITVADSLKSWKKKITMRQVGNGVDILVETEGDPDCSLALTQGVLPSPDGVDRLRLRLYRFFDDLFGTALFLMAANGD